MAHRVYCECKQCRKAKRKGLVLGERLMHYYVHGGPMKYSYYVKNPKWNSGRRPDSPIDYHMDY